MLMQAFSLTDVVIQRDDQHQVKENETSFSFNAAKSASLGINSHLQIHLLKRA